MATFNIYIPSYNRENDILTNKYLEYCTFVVRKSQKERYEEKGVKVLAVEDDLINSIPKVQNWLIDNAEEDVICLIDDDIKSFVYRIEENEKITDTSIITKEIERLAQLVYDLDIGYLSTPNDMSPMYYDREFKFVGVTGQLRIINRKKVVSRFNDIDFLNDVDFALQELLRNRIYLIPNYFIADGIVDTNSGGSNENKTAKKFDIANDIMADKWGKYYEKAGEGKAGKLRVKR